MYRRILIASLAMALCACRGNSYEHESWASGPSISGYTRTSPAAADAPSTLFSADDRDFVETAADGSLFVLESSRLALQKAVSGRTGELANLVIAGHGEALRELGDLVRRKGGTLPGTLAAEHDRQMEQLRDFDGPAFDALYRDLEVRAHEDSIQLFERCTRDNGDPDVRAFATKTLPMLRDHLGRLTSPGAFGPAGVVARGDVTSGR